MNFPDEYEKVLALRQRIAISQLRTLVSLFRSQAAYLRIRQELEAIDAGQIPGALPRYKPSDDPGRKA